MRMFRLEVDRPWSCGLAWVTGDQLALVAVETSAYRDLPGYHCLKLHSCRPGLALPSEIGSFAHISPLGVTLAAPSLEA